MDSFLFRLSEGYTIQSALDELKKIGLHDEYVIEDDQSGAIFIGGLAENIPSSDLKTCFLEESKHCVSWTDQWEQFAEGFREGKAHIDLSRFGSPKTLLLLPGPGFGDLSHPTTYLMLEFMKDCMLGETIYDIGCGSGILSIAAIFMGAKFAYGIDIDRDAISHAKENAALNHLVKCCHFSTKLPKTLSPGIALMNMILPEQKIAIYESRDLLSSAKFWIVSGILKSQKKEALAFYKSLGLQLAEEKKRGEWLGFKLSGCKRVLHHPA